MNLFKYILFVFVLSTFSFCTTQKNTVQAGEENKGIMVAHLNSTEDNGISKISTRFKKNNPGYDLHFGSPSKELAASRNNRTVFIQSGGGTITLSNGKSSKFSIGDILFLAPMEHLTSDSVFSSLIITVPDSPSPKLPQFIRPDWDENITDTPGGCATETNAYRRILLTWKDEVGPYIYHHLNAHRVRIMDSFSHYHPINGGFDEFYLVQMVQKNAQLITSDQVGIIETPDQVTLKQSKTLTHSTPLNVGDLIYIPRGVMHRGLGGVLAQVITVPGFVPGSEIGVDHHLKRINEHLQLRGNDAVPYNMKASQTATIK